MVDEERRAFARRTANRATRRHHPTGALLAKRSLLAIARRELALANGSPNGSSTLVIDLGTTAPRVTVVALKAGHSTDLGEETTAWCIHVLAGRVRARQGRVVAAGLPGDLLTGTSGGRLHADRDAALLVVTGTAQATRPG